MTIIKKEKLIIKDSVWVNIKHQTLYTVTDIVVNSTNGANNQEMVLYESILGFFYVRELEEFLEKFDPKETITTVRIRNEL